MAKFDSRQIVLLLDGREISDWSDGTGVISATKTANAGDYTMGADGKGVFIANPDQSGTLVIKLKQHSPDNAYLIKLLNQQNNSIKIFNPMTLSIRDLINDDVVTASKGYFTAQPDYVRGAGHNAVSWTIQFENMVMNLEKGAQ